MTHKLAWRGAGAGASFTLSPFPFSSLRTFVLFSLQNAGMPLCFKSTRVSPESHPFILNAQQNFIGEFTFLFSPEVTAYWRLMGHVSTSHPISNDWGGSCSRLIFWEETMVKIANRQAKPSSSLSETRWEGWSVSRCLNLEVVSSILVHLGSLKQHCYALRRSPMS